VAEAAETAVSTATIENRKTNDLFTYASSRIG
jgi:hypothetical protein